MHDKFFSPVNLREPVGVKKMLSKFWNSKFSRYFPDYQQNLIILSFPWFFAKFLHFPDILLISWFSW